MNIDIHSDRQPTPNLWTGGRGVIGAIVACTVAAAVGLLPGVGQSRKSSVPDAPAAAAPAVPVPPTVASVSEPAAPPRAATARVAPPVQFSLNLGQSSGEVRYLARGSRLSAEVFDDGIGITGTPQRGAGVALAGTSHAHAAQPARVRLHFLGANKRAAFDAREGSVARAHYLRGSDPSRWVRDVPVYAQLRQPSIYPGVDLVYYGRDGELEYDLVVQPGADPSAIRMRVAGAYRPLLDVSGDLLLDGRGGQLRLHRPVLYQHIDGERKVLDGRYVMLASNEIGFSLPAYDHSRPLIIDPTFKLLYSTYLGGVHDDQVGGMVLDAQNNAYVVGNSGSEDWPVSGNAYQRARKAIGRYVRNVVVTKFDASGTLIYSTFIGGTTNDYGSAIAVDAAGRAYIVGNTNSADFPVTPGAFQTTFRGTQSAYLAVLSPDGSALAYSSLFGGDGGASAAAVALDAAGLVVVGGNAGPGLATTAGAFKTTLAAGNAAFVARFDLAAAGAAQLRAATYYAADAPQANSLGIGNVAYAMALDAAGSAWLTGQAFTTNLPVTADAVMASPASMTTSCSSGSVALNSFMYVAHLSADLKTLAYASYLTGRTGGPAACSEYGHGVAIDAAGSVYVGGSTSSRAYPTTVGALQPTSPANTGFDGYAGFVTKLKSDGSAILWSTYLGGNAGRTYLAGLAADPGGAVWAYTASAGGSNFPVTADAMQKAHGGGTFDASFSKFDGAAGALVYSTFMGGAGDDNAAALAVDLSGNAYAAGTTASGNFPVTANAFQPALTPNAFDGSDWFFSVLGNGTISTVRPATGGNRGGVTLTVSGAGFQARANAELISVATGNSVSADGAVIADDGSGASLSFPLDGKPAGAYDLRITNADGTTFTRRNAFTVLDSGRPNLSVQVIGRAIIRTGVPARFDVVVSNNGSQDAYFLPLWLELPDSVDVKFEGFDKTALGANISAWQSDGTLYLHKMIPALPAGSTTSFPLSVVSPVASDGVPLRATLQAPWFRTRDAVKAWVAAPDAAAGCVTDAVEPYFVDCSGTYRSYVLLSLRPFRGALPRAAAQRTGAAPAQSEQKRPLQASPSCPVPPEDSKIVKARERGRYRGYVDGAAKREDPNKPVPGNNGNDYNIFDFGRHNAYQYGYSQGFTEGQYGIGVPPPNPGAQAAPITGEARPAGVLMRPLAAGDCPPPTPDNLKPQASARPQSAGSVDPNDKTGPSGDGSAAHFVRTFAPFTYQIAFENLASATLPAAEVVVTDQLDPARFDLSTLQLGSILIGTTAVPVPPGLNSYATTQAISAALSVRIQGSLNPATGVLKWTFTSIDPATRLPQSDPTQGFLPPDTDGVKGQGRVTFTVQPKAGLPEGAVISNQASIVFDVNAPILTPTWVNTLDMIAPTSKVGLLTGKAGTASFDVVWASPADSGSAGRSYTVYVSDNGGAYSAWQTAVSTTTATYDGSSGHSYAFYTIATDGAGNTEAAKTVAEASIAVNGNFGAPGSGSDSGGGGCTIGTTDQRDLGLPMLLLVASAALVRRRYARASTKEHPYSAKLN